MDIGLGLLHMKKVPVLNAKEANIKDSNEKVLFFCTNMRQTSNNLNHAE